MQLEGEAALLSGGKVEAVLNLSDSAAMLPRLTGVCPIAVLAGDAGTEIGISGRYLGGGDVTMSSRMHGEPAPPVTPPYPQFRCLHKTYMVKISDSTFIQFVHIKRMILALHRAAPV